MIFSELADRALARSQQRQSARRNFWIGGAYTALGLWLGFDTGLAVWNWQFWLMFLPLFVAGELAAMAWRSARRAVVVPPP